MSYEDYLNSGKDGKIVIMRHDVDNRPNQSLIKARIEKELNVKSTYYFRIVPESNHPQIIRDIAELGHEIGYHYEDLSLANGDFEKAISLFEKNLDYFRQFYPVRTICMHGSPASVWDNRLIWRDYRYHDHGIIAEPYFDLDFSKTLYLTDTGRKWNGSQVSVRDKIKNPFQSKFNFKHTEEIIQAFKTKQLPDTIMVNTHPQRWDDHLIPWLGEYVMQNIKNTIKKYWYISPPMTD